MKKILIILLLMPFTGFVSAQYDLVGKVVNVIDGNTIEIQSLDNKIVRVVLSEVDCPEINQPFGTEAKRFTEKNLKNKKVGIILKGRDRTGSSLGIIYCKKLNFSYKLIEEGYAWHNRNGSQNAPLDSLEGAAKVKKRGLWKEENPTPPWIHRRKESMLIPKTS